MCCDYFHVLIAFTCGFILGLIVIATLTKKFLEEEANRRMNIHARTELKDTHCE